MLLKILLSFQKTKKTPTWSSFLFILFILFVHVDGFVYYVDELLPNNEKH